MNSTQNRKIEQVTAKTLVIRIDVGSEEHCAGRLTTDVKNFRQSRSNSAIRLKVFQNSKLGLRR